MGGLTNTPQKRIVDKDRLQIAYLSIAKVPSNSANSIQIIRMCDAFSALGHKVILFCDSELIKKGSELAWCEIRRFYEIQNDFEIVSVDCASKFRRILAGLRMAWMARQKNVDIAFGRFLPGIAWSAILGLNTILEIHAPVNGWSRFAYLGMLGRGKRLGGLVSISRALEVYECSVDFPAISAEKSLVAPEGAFFSEARKQRNEMRKALGIPAEQFCALYCGSLYKGKGIDLLLEVAAIAREIVFVIVGGQGQTLQNYKTLVARKCLDNVVFTGFVPPSDVSSYLSLADVFLLPNQKSVIVGKSTEIGKWTSPLKLFEYMTTGKPILISDLDVLREVVDERCVQFCDPEDPLAWVDKLEEVRRDYRRYSEMANMALSRARTNSWEARAAKCVSLASKAPIAPKVSA